MDQERTSRELKRTAKRRQKALSSVPHHHHHGGGGGGRDSNQLSVLCNGGWVGGGEMVLSERLKKERGRGSRGSTSSNDDDSGMGGDGGGGGSDGEEEQLRPPLTTAAATITSVSSRKRAKLHGRKVPAAVDPAPVPRKLRSAINKRSSELASPPLPDAKKKHHRVSGGNALPDLNGKKESKRSQMHDPLTQDEEEVAETLFALATLTPPSKPAENRIDGRSSEEKSEFKTKMVTSPSFSEAALKEDPGQLPLIPTNGEATNISSNMERSLESVKVESVVVPTVVELPTSISGSKDLNLELNGTAQENLQSAFPLLKNECVVDSTKTMSLPNAMDDLSEAHSDGVLRTTQPEVLPLQNPEIGLMPVTSAATEQDKMLEHSVRLGSPEEATLGVQPDLPTTSVHLTLSSSAEAAVGLDSVSCSARPHSTGNDFPIAKLPLVLADRRQSWKNCMAHVFISRIIQNYQKTEKRSSWPLPAIQLDHKDGPRLGLVAANGPIGLKDAKGVFSSPGVNGFSLDTNQQEARIRVLPHDRRLQPDQQTSTPSGEGYSHQTLVQLQLPHYVGNPFYGMHMGHVEGSTKQQQQQQMWQAHLAQYSSTPAILKWTNGRSHEQSSPSSLVPCSQAQPVIPHSPPFEVLRGGGAHHHHHHHHHPTNLQPYQLVSIPPPPSASSMAVKHHQHHPYNQGGGGGYEGHGGGGVFRPDKASQLQLLCNGPHL